MARRRNDNDCLGCLVFPAICWGVIPYQLIMPAISNATGLQEGYVLFFLIFLIVPVILFLTFAALPGLIGKTAREIRGLLRR